MKDEILDNQINPSCIPLKYYHQTTGGLNCMCQHKQCFIVRCVQCSTKLLRGCRGCDRMVVGFTTAYAISSYIH